MFLRLSLGAVDVFVRYRTFCLLLAHKCFSLCVGVWVCVCVVGSYDSGGRSCCHLPGAITNDMYIFVLMAIAILEKLY